MSITFGGDTETDKVLLREWVSGLLGATELTAMFNDSARSKHFVAPVNIIWTNTHLNDYPPHVIIYYQRPSDDITNYTYVTMDYPLEFFTSEEAAEHALVMARLSGTLRSVRDSL